MSQSFKETLKGVAEIFVFMPSAIDRFSPERGDAIRSFAYPLFFYPFILYFFSRNNDITDPATLIAHVVISWAGLIGFYGIIWWVTKYASRAEKFWHFVHVSNAQAILSMAFFTIGAIGYNTIKPAFEQYWIFYILADLFYCGFIIGQTLRFPWPLAAFWATVSLFISDVSFRAIMAVHEWANP